MSFTNKMGLLGLSFLEEFEPKSTGDCKFKPCTRLVLNPPKPAALSGNIVQVML